MRIYIPVTLSWLARIATEGEVEADYVAYAVTPALREWYTNGDREELEYAAMAEAARESLRRLAADPSSPARRVVISADVPDDAVKPLSGPGALDARGAVRVGESTPVRRFASIHADGDAARADIQAAVAALARPGQEPSASAAPHLAGPDDEDTQFLLDTVEDHELLWYATQEIPDLLTLG